jgi:hypothetical protein
MIRGVEWQTLLTNHVSVGGYLMKMKMNIYIKKLLAEL